MDVSKYVGRQIRKYRLLKNMTQKELGLRIGVKHNTISSYETGINEPEQNILFAIAGALDININDLFPPPVKDNFMGIIGEAVSLPIVGYNPDWKRNINIGKNNNQKFTQIPHGNLRLKLQSLCDRYGINYLEQEESYTSKADFFANDILPVYNPDNPQKYSFSGKRISRGQYETCQGIIINADCNGALNILRKSNLVDLTVLQARGCLNQPQRIRVVTKLL